MTAPLVVTLKEAEQLVPWSEKTLRRAIVGHDPKTPPLKAKRDSKSRLPIKVSDLQAWHDAFPDA